MKFLSYLSLLALFLPVALVADVASDARAERPALLKEFPAALAPVTDNPGLPRVLIIGDSISLGYTPIVREMLHGVANVHRIPDNGGPTVRGLAMLDEWLGTGHWDVITFNFGLHDIALKHGQTRTTPAEYEQNLRTIVKRLRATGAHLVFVTTTPVPASTGTHPARHDADVLVRNRIAQQVMADNHVAVCDLYSFVRPQEAQIQLPVNVHYTPAGYRALAGPVTAAIRAALPAPTHPKL